MDHPFIEEHDLVTRYVAGHVSPEEIREFEAHFVDCPTCLRQLEAEQEFRVGLMRLHGARVATPSPGHATRPRLPMRMLATAAVVVLAVGATLGYVQTRRQLTAERARVTTLEHDVEQARARADALSRPQVAAPPPAASQARVALFELDATRGAGPTSTPSLVIPSSTSLVVFSLAVGNAADFARFAATIEKADGTPLVRQDDLQSGSPTSVAVALDAHDFVSGDYSIVLEGAIRNRPPATIARYPLRVIRR